MKSIRIVVVDNEMAIHDQLRQGLMESLESAFPDFTNVYITVYQDVRDAFSQLYKQNVSCIVLNPAIVPVYDEIIIEMKAFSKVPLIIFTHTSSLEEMIHFMKLGADKTIPKPIAYLEYYLSVKSLLSLYYATPETQNSILTYKELSLYPIRKEAHFEGSNKMLTTKEYDVLHFLANNPGRLVTAKQIYVSIWEYNPHLIINTEKSVADIVHRLRKKIGHSFNDTYLRSKYGSGYMFAPDIMYATQEMAVSCW